MRCDEYIRCLPSEYVIENYEDWHLGSNGQRTGIRYGGIDDFHLMVPSFETNITNNYTGETGSYQDVLIERAVLEQESRAVYDICYGNSMSGYFYNPNAVNDKTVVLVSDSMGKVVAPFVILVNFLFLKSDVCIFSIYFATKNNFVVGTDFCVSLWNN